eukprot:TRINITY_DN6183_c0_g1_i3.p1 TRINITY_DN6183_c0_g1~~TRINITY_DN6183_c0_g1_i3.p1  ORF type:complete len:183 (+),score=26.84 TRINITY_DN6183_c0_g1_i3:67-549(+)
MGIKDSFDSQIIYRVGTREGNFFLHDIWVGDQPLAAQFLDLYRCARNKQAKVKDYMDRDAERILWGPIFRRDLTESEEKNLMNLLDKLGRIFIPIEGEDSRVWVASKDGVFSVSSFFMVMSNGHNSHNWFDYLWKTNAPPKVLAFGWLALQGSILTSHYG